MRASIGNWAFGGIVEGETLGDIFDVFMREVEENTPWYVDFNIKRVRGDTIEFDLLGSDLGGNPTQEPCSMWLCE